MKQGIKLFVILIAILPVLWGISLISLGFNGISANAQNVHVHRILGERNEIIPNQYTYVIAYEFSTNEGKLVSGHTQSIGSSYSVKTLKKIRYFKRFPIMNAPQENTGIKPFPFFLLGIGILILWVIGTGNSKTLRSVGQKRKSSHNISNKNMNQLLNAQEWLRKYRNNSRLYAWLFFAGMAIVISIIVRLDLGVWNEDWLYSTGFAVIIMWILAIFSRRKTESSWQGVIVSKEIISKSDNINQEMNATPISYLIHVKTDNGKDEKIHVTPGLFDLYFEGEPVRKIAGLNFPIIDSLDVTIAFCPVCGNLLNGAIDQCPSCRAPIFEWTDLR